MFDSRPSSGHAFGVILLVGLLLLIVVTPVANASGEQGMVLTEEAIEDFRTLTAEDVLSRRLTYVGSTDKWHAFMLVETSTGGDMPWSYLSTFKVAVDAVTVVNGWTIFFSEHDVSAPDCPSARASQQNPGHLEVPSGERIRRRCGTWTSTPEVADVDPVTARCEAMPFDIVVTDEGDLLLNGAASDLNALSLAAREKAAACEGGTPHGSYEGPNYVTVTASKIWPVLRQELPDLDLEMRHRGPDGRSTPSSPTTAIDPATTP